MQTWTVLGLSRFFPEIESLVEANGGVVSEIVIHQEPDDVIVKRIPPDIQLVRATDFIPRTDCYVFGFNNVHKQELLDALEKFDLHFANLIHPSVITGKGVSLGQGNVINAGVVIGAGSTVGNFNSINRSASIGHGVEIGNQNHIGPNATVCGEVVIEDHVFVGAGSVCINDIAVCSDVMIGAGAVVTSSIEFAGTYVGIPAKLLLRQ